MNLTASYQYQLKKHIVPIITFYLILICLYAALYLSFAATSDIVRITKDQYGNITSTTTVSHGNVGISGISGAVVIFIFIVALNSFKENFGMQLQNGISRRTIFIGRIVTTFTIAAGLAMMDEVLLLILKAFASSSGGYITASSIFEQIYSIGTNPFVLGLYTITFDFFLFLGFMAFGYFITLLFYRLNIVGKTIVGAGVPILFFIVIPYLDNYVIDKKIGKAYTQFIEFALGQSSNQPYRAFITYFLMFVLFSGLGWLLIRKASVKE